MPPQSWGSRKTAMEERDINKLAYKGHLNFFYAQMNKRPFNDRWVSPTHWVRVNLNITNKHRTYKGNTEGYSRPDKITE